MVRLSKDTELLARSVARAVATGSAFRTDVRRYVIGEYGGTMFGLAEPESPATVLLGVIDAADSMLWTAIDVAHARKWIEWDESPSGGVVDGSIRVGPHIGEALGEAV